MLCTRCKKHPHTEQDCEYPNSCTCQHRSGDILDPPDVVGAPVPLTGAQLGASRRTKVTNMRARLSPQGLAD